MGCNNDQDCPELSQTCTKILLGTTTAQQNLQKYYTICLQKSLATSAINKAGSHTLGVRVDEHELEKIEEAKQQAEKVQSTKIETKPEEAKQEAIKIEAKPEEAKQEAKPEEKIEEAKPEEKQEENTEEENPEEENSEEGDTEGNAEEENSAEAGFGHDQEDTLDEDN